MERPRHSVDDSGHYTTNGPSQLTGSFQSIVESHLRDRKNKKRLADIESGTLGCTWPEAVQDMAEALAQQFASQGTFNGTDTPLQSHIAEAAKRLKGKHLPLEIAFQSTLGKKRMTAIRERTRATIFAKAELSDKAQQRALYAALTWFNNNNNGYKGMGWGMKYTVTEAHDIVVARIEAAAQRYVESAEIDDHGIASATLPIEALDLAADVKAAESVLTSPVMSALEAACYPVSTDGVAVAPLLLLMCWGSDEDPAGHRSFEVLTSLANQCAKLVDLDTRDLKALASEVARRVHYPFGLMKFERHANMLAAQYCFAGETPSTAMVFAWRFLEQSDTADLLRTESYIALLQKTLSSLAQGIRLATRYSKALSFMRGQPAAVDVLRLLASTVVAAHDDPTRGPSWPAGLLATFLNHYGVEEGERHLAADLLMTAFPLTGDSARKADWTAPSLEWVTVGSTYLYRLVRFVWESPWLGQSDLEDLKSESDQRLPLVVLKELRDCQVRAESPFPCGNRRTFTSSGVLNTNNWLKKNLERRANREFARITQGHKDAFREIRRQVHGRLTEEIKAATGQDPELPYESNGWVSPEGWFVLASAPESFKRLSTLVSSNKAVIGMTPMATKKAAGHLLQFLTLATNSPLSAPRHGQSAQDWLITRIAETNDLGAYELPDEEESGKGDDPWETGLYGDEIQIDLYGAQDLTRLLEATVRQLETKDDK